MSSALERGPIVVHESVALEVLRSDQELTPAKQEILVRAITDPFMCSELLEHGYNGREWTQGEAEHLAQHMSKSLDAVSTFFISLVDSGAVYEMNETELFLVRYLGTRVEDPEMAEYFRTEILPHMTDTEH